MNFTAIDFETSSSTKLSSCAIGLVAVNGDNEREFYSVIKPLDMTFTRGNMAVHKISKKEIMAASDFGDLWPCIEDFVQDRILVAHNAAFDVSVLRSNLRVIGVSYPRARYICTLDLASKAWPELQSYKLSTLGEALLEDQNAHNALSDAKVCVAIVKAAMKEFNAISLEDLCKALRVNINPLSLAATINYNGQKQSIAFLNKGEAKRSFFYNKIIHLNGRMNFIGKDLLKELLISHGAKIVDSVDSRFSILLVRDKRRMNKTLAKVMGRISRGEEIEIINEEELLDLLCKASR